MLFFLNGMKMNDERCLQELRALQLQQALQKNMTQEQVRILQSEPQ